MKRYAVIWRCIETLPLSRNFGSLSSADPLNKEKHFFYRQYSEFELFVQNNEIDQTENLKS
jgi:hypothetical protein